MSNNINPETGELVRRLTPPVLVTTAALPIRCEGNMTQQYEAHIGQAPGDVLEQVLAAPR
jgi:hypothetical protein